MTSTGIQIFISLGISYEKDRQLHVAHSRLLNVDPDSSHMACASANRRPSLPGGSPENDLGTVGIPLMLPSNTLVKELAQLSSGFLQHPGNPNMYAKS